MKKQLEEFMVFINKDGRSGVILKSDDRDYRWRKCFKGGQRRGQLFDEWDRNFNKIARLYKINNGRDKLFYALSFMSNGDLSWYDCVYDSAKEGKEKTNPINITLNLTLNNPDNLEEVLKNIEKEISKAKERIEND